MPGVADLGLEFLHSDMHHLQPFLVSLAHQIQTGFALSQEALRTL
jgi:hypothetical protein